MRIMRYLHFQLQNEDSIARLEVNKTLLTWCITLPADHKLWRSVSKESMEQLKKQCDERKKRIYIIEEPININIRLRDANNNIIVEKKETVIYQRNENNGDRIRINLSKISLELQRIFWFTTITTIMNERVNNSDRLKFKSDIFKEKVEVSPIVDQSNGEKSGICIKPISVVASDMVNSKDHVQDEEVNYLLKMICDMMNSNTYRLEKKQNKSDKHANKIINAGQWKAASKFEGIDTCLKNCIYYLASEPEEGKPANLYIGEAQSIGKRLITKEINGRTYIGHSERERDFKTYKFTRYRIDQISTRDAMHNAQDTLIGAFNMSDYDDFPNGFKLINKAFNKAHSEANKTRKNNK